MTEEEKKIITQEKHPRRVAQGHKLATLMKKRKEDTLDGKEQSTEQQPVESSVVFSTAASTEDWHHNTDAIYFLPKMTSN